METKKYDLYQTGQLLLRALKLELESTTVLFRFQPGAIFYPGDGLTARILIERKDEDEIRDLTQNEIQDYLFWRLVDDGYDVQTDGISFTGDGWPGSRLLTDDGSVLIDGIDFKEAPGEEFAMKVRVKQSKERKPTEISKQSNN
jgi:hypothetical protein